MRLYAPAKINWTLEVLGRRPDGYHELRTVLQTIGLWDVLELEPAPQTALDVEGCHQATEDDLVLRAARLLGEEAGLSAGVRFRLRKAIPVAAGLGGGSSDAAAALRGLDRLWGLAYGRERLSALAARLGSDVPFFLHGGTALARGRGEVIEPLPEAPQAWLVLVVPPLSLPGKTGRMYASLSAADFSDGSASEALAAHLRRGGRIEEGMLLNAFQGVAYEVFPGLAAYREALLAAGARRVHLAGSGPALFALAADRSEAESLRRALRLSGGRALVARTVGAWEALRVEG